jgi:hypothetical protein
MSSSDFRITSETANFRKVQLRGSFVNKSGEPILMANEQTKSRYPNVKYFIENSQLVGILTITNIRIIWVGKDPSSNFSVPWVCIKSIKIK